MTEAKLFVMSDPHFSHGNILRYTKRTEYLTSEEIRKLEEGVDFRVSRESVDRMNRGLIENINAVVGEDDILWTLGDWSFPSNYKTAMYFRSQINCRNVHKVFGNHDSPQIAAVFDKPDLGSRKQNEKFVNEKNIHHIIEFWHEGVYFVLTHYSMSVWNGSHRKSVNIYGHSHANAEGWLDKMMPNRRSMDAGVDNAFRLVGAYRPFSFEEIKKFVASRPGSSIDHHQVKT